MDRFCVATDRQRRTGRVRRLRRSYSDPSLYSSVNYGPSRTRLRPIDRDLMFTRAKYQLTGAAEGGKAPKQKAKSDQEKKAEKEAEKKKEVLKPLLVKKINLEIKKNTTQHKTNQYGCTGEQGPREDGSEPELVIRRGDTFLLTITFDRKYDLGKHDLRFIFSTGETARPNMKTQASFPLDEKSKKNARDSWNAVIVETKEADMTVSIFVPPNCVIGEWQFSVKTIVQNAQGEKENFRYENPDDVTILLNPWCKEDKVYMKEVKLLDEYVLNDSGNIYTGNYRQISPKSWNFGQFEDGILSTSLHLLRKAMDLKVDQRMGNPVEIARALSKIVNNCDDEGVLVGNWSGDYGGGKHPCSWPGSVAILKNYDKFKKSVCYGQCWVFSGVLTTVCRALGLPCRSVTCFQSAHDTDQSRTIDKFFTLKDGEVNEDERGGDSIWNFHVWNEVWMSRPELKPEYSGWQVIDATPQELSGDVFCCGPAPVEAIKAGDVTVPYDTHFVFAEVNADIIDWLVVDFDEYFVMNIHKKKVGKCISTKGILPEDASVLDRLFDNQRDDLTLNYKHPEESAEEREAVKRAVASSGVETMPYELKTKVEVAMEEKTDVKLGDDFSYDVTVTNKEKEQRTLDVVVSIFAQSYIGARKGKIKSQRFSDVVLKPGQSHKMTIKTTYDEYIGKTVEGFVIESRALVLVKEDRVYLSDNDVFRLIRPDLTVEGPNTCKPGETISVKMTFTNPLKKKLTKCYIAVEGALVPADGKEEIQCSDVAEKANFETTMKLTPKKAIWPMANFIFNCEELPDLYCSYRFMLGI